MTTRWKCLALSLALVSGLATTSPAEWVTYEVSGGVPALSSGSYEYTYYDIANDEWIFIKESYTEEPGSIGFEFKLSFDTTWDQPFPIGAVGGFSTGRLAVEAITAQDFLDSAPGQGPDHFHVWGQAPGNAFADGGFHLYDPSGAFFETGNLRGVRVSASITVTAIGKGGYDAYEQSTSIQPVPEPSTLALLGIAAACAPPLVLLGRLRKRPSESRSS